MTIHIPKLLACSIAAAAFMSSAWAQKTWIGADAADWATGANWNPSGPPTTSDALRFDSGTYSVTASGNVSGGALLTTNRTGTITLNLGESNTLTAGAWEVRFGGLVLSNGNYTFSSFAVTTAGGATNSANVTISGANTAVNAAGMANSFTRNSSSGTLRDAVLTVSAGAKLTNSSTTGDTWFTAGVASAGAVASNTVTVTGSGSVFSNAAATWTLFRIAGGGTLPNSILDNLVEVKDGGRLATRNLILATRTAGTNTDVTGNRVVVSGTDALLQIDGTLSIGAVADVGNNNGLQVLTGGKVNVTSTSTIGAANTASYLRVDGGEFNAGTNSVTVGGGASVSSLRVSTNGTFIAGSLTGAGEFGNAANANAAFASGTMKVGNLVQTTNSYTFTVGDGIGAAGTAVYEMTGAGTHQVATGFTVASDGRLAGVGRISGTATTNTATTLTLSGHLLPSSATTTGTITLAGDLVTNPGAEYLFNIGGASDFDQVVGTGNAGFNGTLRVTLLNSYNPAINSSFKLFDFGTYSGTSITYDLPSLSGGLSWNTHSFLSNGTLSVVPEPSTYVAAAGLIGLLLWPAGWRWLRGSRLGGPEARRVSVH
jgi:hypothetical protein